LGSNALEIGVVLRLECMVAAQFGPTAQEGKIVRPKLCEKGPHSSAYFWAKQQSLYI
jgi:hypothetical protein